MALWLVVGLVPVAIILVLFFLVLVGKGKRLKCPSCGTVFTAPAMDLKRTGLGWTFPYLGRVKCPECGKSRSRRDYQKSEPQPIAQ